MKHNRIATKKTLNIIDHWKYNATTTEIYIRSTEVKEGTTESEIEDNGAYWKHRFTKIEPYIQ